MLNNSSAKQLRCYMCRCMFKEYETTEAKHFKLEIPENPFFFPDMEEYKKLQKYGLKDMTDFWFRDGVFLNGKKVSLRHFEEILKWVQGKTPRKVPDMREKTSPRPQIQSWRDLFDDCGWYGS